MVVEMARSAVWRIVSGSPVQTALGNCHLPVFVSLTISTNSPTGSNEKTRPER